MIEDLIKTKNLSGSAMRLALFLTTAVEEDKQTIRLQLQQVAEILGVMPQALSRSFKQLWDAGLASQEPFPDGNWIVLARPVQNIKYNNNININNKSITTTPKKTRAQRAAQVEVPEWISAEVWEEFVRMRNRIRRPLTPYAAELIISKLKNFGPSLADQILEQSIINGWAGVFPLKDFSARQGGSEGKQSINDLVAKLEGL